MFNEPINYKSVKYDSFYNLYKIFNNNINFSRRFHDKIDRLKKNLNPVKKGNRCLKCSYPFAYIRNSRLKGFTFKPCIKKCEICPKIQYLESYKLLTYELNNILEDINKKIETTNKEDKTTKTKRTIVEQLCEIIDNLI